MIGQPHHYDTTLASCELTNGQTTLPFDAAVASGWVDPVVYYYVAGGYYTTRTSAGDDAYLRPWRGYWLLTNTDDLTLMVP